MAKLTGYEDELFDRMALAESLRSICRDDRMPCTKAVYNRINSDRSFARRWAFARQIAADTLADELMDLVRHEHNPRNARLLLAKADSIKWMSAKLFPDQWGERVRHKINATGNVTLRIEH